MSGRMTARKNPTKKRKVPTRSSGIGSSSSESESSSHRFEKKGKRRSNDNNGRGDEEMRHFSPRQRDPERVRSEGRITICTLEYDHGTGSLKIWKDPRISDGHLFGPEDPNASWNRALREIVFDQPVWLDRKQKGTLRNPDIGSVISTHLVETQTRRVSYAMSKKKEKENDSDSDPSKNPNQKKKGTSKKWIHLEKNNQGKKGVFSKVDPTLREAILCGMESKIFLPPPEDEESGTNFTDSEKDS